MNLLEQGGIIMIPLLICSVLMIAIIVERLIVYTKTLKTALQDWPNPTSVVKCLRQRMVTLHTLIGISPMLGLLGTVTGLMKCFNLLGVQTGNYQPQEISLGISEALITTAFGLVIAIIATIFYNYFSARLEAYLEEYNSGIDCE